MYRRPCEVVAYRLQQNFIPLPGDRGIERIGRLRRRASWRTAATAAAAATGAYQKDADNRNDAENPPNLHGGPDQLLPED